jgi:N-acetyl-alpha-D-muramate 1-phosphate uridylyltransferase
MNGPVRSGMVLAAGYGTRMRPLTDATPKPLLRIAGRTLLDHALDRLGAAGVERVVVNAHWHADQVRDRLRTRALRGFGRPDTLLQEERELLDTGGGVLHALRSGALPGAPFFVVNGDSFWLEGPCPALGRMAAAFDPDATDVLLLLCRTPWCVGEVGRGDFALDPEGRLHRATENEIVPYVFAGVQLLSPQLFDSIGGGSFSMNLLWDQAIGADRMRAIVHDGAWFHLSRPSDIVDTERALRDPLWGPSTT